MSQRDTRAKQLQLHVEDLLLFMNGARVKKADFGSGGVAWPLRHFDKAEPFTLVEATHATAGEGLYPMDATPWDLGGRLDATVISRLTDSSALLVRRFRTVRRGREPFKRFARVMIEEARLIVDPRTGTGKTAVKYYGTNEPDGDWFPLQQGFVRIYEDEIRALQTTFGIAFARDYQWHAHLKWPGAEAGVMIPTTPEGARALFRLRDYEAGTSRRKALIHWVTEHSRRIRKDTQEETRVWVREHMRGATKFRWQDMEGAIYPAAHDLRRLEQAKGGTR